MDHSTFLPKEVSNFLRARKCPVCRSELDVTTSDSEMYQLMGVYNVWSDCAADSQHYRIDLNWHDPKFILVNLEQVSFEYDGWSYEVTAEMHGMSDSMINRIILYQGEDANPEELTVHGDIFNFRKFSARKTAEKIQMLCTFS